MLLQITTTHHPATDLGYLLHKHPDKVQEFELPFGKAQVFYPEATAERTTAVLALDIDSVGLVRNRRGSGGEGPTLDQYVNDRPYTASSFLSVALAKVFGSALSGQCKTRPELIDVELPFLLKLEAVPCRGGERFLRSLFEPLGYQLNCARLPLDERFPEWGESPYFSVELSASKRLRELLQHVYVLAPVLDDDKHYWVGDDEVDKLLRHGGEWLKAHPAREEIAERYLKRKRSLVRDALARLLEESTSDPDQVEQDHDREEAAVEEKISLHQLRIDAVTKVLEQSGASRVLDLGCGEGRLLARLLKVAAFREIVGMDVSMRSLQIAARRLRLDGLPERQRARIQLLHGSLLYRDSRLTGYDAAALVEVIEHLDAARLGTLERTVFEFARPNTVVITTPNVEYNVKFESLPAGRMRHKDHRFEWTRAEFGGWCQGLAARFGYAVRIDPLGPEDAVVGAPSHLGVFTRTTP